jgi:RNA-binding protein YlmH
VKEDTAAVNTLDTICLSYCIEMGIDSIRINLSKVEGKWRLDKLLSAQITDLSRSRVEKMIEHGTIKVNDQNVSPGTFLRDGYVISIKTT